MDTVDDVDMLTKKQRELFKQKTHKEAKRRHFDIDPALKFLNIKKDEVKERDIDEAFDELY